MLKYPVRQYGISITEGPVNNADPFLFVGSAARDLRPPPTLRGADKPRPSEATGRGQAAPLRAA